MMKAHQNTFVISLFLVIIILIIISCASIKNSNIPVIQSFDKEKYLGKWFEIVRTDNRFQRGLINSSANYTLNSDGSIKVTNRGFDAESNEWRESIGKAKFVGEDTIGRLKVSFFGPFYGAYNVVAIDDDYQTVLVMGDDPKYLWILSRQKTIPELIKTNYLTQAKQLGVDIDKLIWNITN